MSSSAKASLRPLVIKPWWLFVCGVVIVAVGGFVFYLHVWEKLELTWPLLVLIGFTCLPFLLPLLGVYLRKVSTVELNQVAVAGRADFAGTFFARIGERLVRLLRFLRIRLETFGPEGLNLELPEKPKEAAPAFSGAFATLSVPSQKTLRTLWLNQKNSNVVWGFRVPESADDYVDFSTGSADLVAKELAEFGSRGLLALTEAGRNYCKEHAAEISEDGPMWKVFRPA